MMNEGLGIRRICPTGSHPERGPKLRVSGFLALAGPHQNRYISCNLQYLIYDRVVRVGPPGPALFYYLNHPCPTDGPDQGTRSDGQTPGEPELHLPRTFKDCI
ncbi:hypothetical protein BRAS3843_1890005 [Bradyrhizobium sp. STM 3843]|nr:hypothetical protein BRAS3843_1890005 [Bradyrhizobium sp. STM 3843]